MEKHTGGQDRYANSLLRSGEVAGAVELRTDRELAIWRRAQDDARELMRQIAVENGYTTNGVRLREIVPSPADELHFYQKAWTRMGPFTSLEDDLYLRSFRNTCLEGYPHKDS